MSKKYKVGIVGIGMVGGALRKYFESKPAYEVSLHLYDKKGIGSMEEVNKADFIYLCLPTPYNPDMGCDTSILEGAIEEIKPGKVLIVKSTVPPGTTDYLQKVYPKQRFVFNPEFLTEETCDQDMRFPDRQIVGYTEESFTIVKDVLQQLPLAPFERIVPAKVAEFIKYGNNTWFSTKVAKNNEMYDLAMKIGFTEEEWEMFVDGIASDRRIGRTHLKIIHKGKRGYWGKCLVEGTKLITEGNEFINIEDVKVGEYIYDGNNMVDVTAKSEREVDSTIKITARGRSITGSKDHIHLVFDNNSIVERKLEDIKVGDYLFVPMQKDKDNNSIDIGPKPKTPVRFWKEVVKIDNNLARLLGLYCAEGCMNKSQNSVIWSFGGNEESLAAEVVKRLEALGIKGEKKLQISDGTFGLSTCWIVRCKYRWFYDLLNKIGVGHCAQNKDIPLLPIELAKIFIGGWLEGDGSYYDGTIAGHSESIDLIRKIDTMLLSVGIISQISKDGKKIKISTREDVEKICEWVTRFKFDESRYVTKTIYNSPTVKKIDLFNGWAVRITSIDELPGQKVYAIETKSGRYVANNILTHNCLPKDTKALLEFAKKNDVKMPVLDAADQYNDKLLDSQGYKKYI